MYNSKLRASSIPEANRPASIRPQVWASALVPRKWSSTLKVGQFTSANRQNRQAEKANSKIILTISTSIVRHKSVIIFVKNRKPEKCISHKIIF